MRLWREDRVHAWLGVERADGGRPWRSATREVGKIIEDSGGAHVGGFAGCSAAPDRWESLRRKNTFGYTDGFGESGLSWHREKRRSRGRAKRMPDGSWAAASYRRIAAWLRGTRREKLPPAPVPPPVGKQRDVHGVPQSCTKMWRAFRQYLAGGKRKVVYGGGPEKKLAAKIVGRWPDGTPLEMSPDGPDPELVKDPQTERGFCFWRRYGPGCAVPWGAHVRRVNPRDSFGFNGKLIDRRRDHAAGVCLTGPYAPPGEPVSDTERAGRDLHGF